MSLLVLYINIILTNIISVSLGKIQYLRNCYNNNEIHLVIKGKGIQNLLSSQFVYDPSAVFVNGNHNISCTKSCYLKEDINNITLQFSQQINTSENKIIY